jgi:proline dehydrogenase
MSDFLHLILRVINTLALKGLISNKIGMKIFNSIAETYIGGHSIEEGLKTIERFYCNGMFSTFNILGGSATTVEESDKCIGEYINMVDMIDNTFKYEKPCTISVEANIITSVDGKTHKINKSETSLNFRLEKLVRYAAEKDIDITLDMDDHVWTDLSLDAAQYIWNQGLKLGIVLQSRLHRTKDDIKKLFIENEYKIPIKYIRVRVCIGIFDEAKTIATKSKKEAKKRLVERIVELFDAGVYVEIATHDNKVIDTIINEIIKPRNINIDKFEFQFLKGVQIAYKIKDRLLDEGYKVRFYIPTELNPGDGLDYMIFRLYANPVMVLSGAKNTIQLVLNTFRKKLYQ